MIVLDRHEFHFQSEAITLDVPIPRLQVRIGEEEERIYFRDTASPEWEVFTSDFDILEHPFIPQMRVIRDRMSRSASKNELVRRLKILGYVVAVIAVLVWLADLGMSLMVDML